MEIDLDDRMRYAFELRFQAVPLKASLYHFLPLRSNARLFFRGGAIYCFGKIDYRFSYATMGADPGKGMEIEGKATDGALGAHAGIGLEFRVGRKTAFSIEGQAVYCRLNDWRGREVSREGESLGAESGTIWFEPKGDTYGEPLPVYLSCKTSGTRKFAVDLSGFSLKAGFIVRL
jgi:hypothetical protein